MSDDAKTRGGRLGAVSGRLGWALLPIVVTAVVLAILPPIWFGDSPYTTSLAVQALVFASYLMPGKPMDLRFSPFEVLAVGISVAIVNLVAQDGESNWLEGALLLAVYLVLGIAFYFLP